MASDFDEEKEMYSQLKKWLVNEEGCDEAFHVGEASFKFTRADKGYITDVIGRKFDVEGNPQYIGIEAKNLVRDSQKIINQCVSSLAFCHKAYLALPKKLFHNSSAELQQLIKDRVRLQNVGLLLVLKTRVDEIVEPPSQRLNLRIFNQAGEFFQELGEESEYSEEMGEWSDTQAEMFVENLRAYAPSSFDHSEDIVECSLYDDDVYSITLSHPYHDEVDIEILIYPEKVTIEIIRETWSEYVIDAFLSKYEVSDFYKLFEVYDRRPKRWLRRGMNSRPFFEIELPDVGMTFRFGEEPTESAIFNLGTFLKNQVFSDNERFYETPAKMTIYGEFNRASWQKALSTNEESLMELLHSLIEQASLLLSHIDEE